MRIEFIVDSPHIDDLMLYGSPDPGFNGHGFTREGLDGWDDVTDLKESIEERPQGDGGFGLGDPWRASRLMTLNAFARGADFRQAQRMRQDLAALYAQRRILMRVTDPFSSSYRWVRAVRAKLPRPSSRQFEYTVDLVAVDPFRYEDAEPTTTGLPSAGTGITWPRVWPITWGQRGATGRMRLANPGTADAWPWFTLTQGGVGDGFEIEEVGTGRLIRFEQTVLIGSEVVITPRTGTVLVDGVSRSTFLTRRDWFQVPASGSTEVQFRVLGDSFGDPILTAITPPTYV